MLVTEFVISYTNTAVQKWGHRFRVLFIGSIACGELYETSTLSFYPEYHPQQNPGVHALADSHSTVCIVLWFLYLQSNVLLWCGYGAYGTVGVCVVLWRRGLYIYAILLSVKWK